MTTFETEFLADAWPDLAAEFGESVTYNPDGGSPATITVVWQPDSIMDGYYEDATMDVKLGVIRCSSADVATPDICDTFTIGGVTWAVKAIRDQAATVTMQLQRLIQQHVGGAHTRIER